MRKNRKNKAGKIETEYLILMAVIFLLLCATVVNYILYRNAIENSRNFRIQGNAVGLVRICINNPPAYQNTCSNYVNVSQDYYCNVNATDRDGQNITYGYISPIFYMDENGTITFTPVKSQIGEYISYIYADDGTFCSNSNTTQVLNIRVCMPPVWFNFMNNVTTNFSNYECWNNITNITIGKPNMVVMNFTGNFGVDGYDFDSNINITRNFLYINITEFPNFYGNISTTFYDIRVLNTSNLTIVHNGDYCLDTECKIISVTNDTATFNLTNLNGSYFVVEETDLDLSDDTDNYIRYVNETVGFYVNYTYLQGSPVVNGTCDITIYVPGENNNTLVMPFNSTLEVFVYNRTFRMPGVYLWKADCYKEYSSTDYHNATITNRLPIQTSSLPNVTWNSGQTVSGIDLDNYFVEPDGEQMSYSVDGINHISIVIDPITNDVTFSGDPGWYGNATTYFYAYDQSSGITRSNLVYLQVMYVSISSVPTPTSTTTGGGGGGGGAFTCLENWKCGDWDECLPTLIQIRDCYQTNGNCNATEKKPSLSQTCNYFPTCYDSVKNGEEIGVDCGGPICKPCATCSDGIQNQGEENVDCGGPCQRCSSCFDGLKNGEEIGVDCGGPICKPCATCSDGIQNQKETSIDCGGSCSACPACSDGIQNQGEENVDCGGPCSNKCSIIQFPAPGSSTVFNIVIVIIMFVGISYIFARKKINAWILNFWRWIIGLFKRKKKDEKDYLYWIDNIIRKIDALETKVGAMDIKEIFDMHYNAMILFIGQTLTGGHSAAHGKIEQLIREKTGDENSVREIEEYIKSIDDMKFRDSEISEKEMLIILKNSKKFVLETFKPIAEMAEEKSMSVENIITKIEGIINSNPKTAKMYYRKALIKYKEMKYNEQKKIYEKIKKLGGRLKEREKLR